ncbi:hypothetical protein HPB47_013614 [Ixodes persulcatus]|uniref:Uncharacterized protein n=1 Tax=Ixodes persulcatus TaxID=34615 RepID=A0AC60R1N2_IXOPE|nr:hypothetical protein HPB47_013614 [Ixodes persulcatus]
MSRQEATDMLMAEHEAGIFLVRNSATISGDLVLCVREENKVSHYIINRVSQDEQTRFRIGDQMFPDIPSLLNFYKLHYLDTTPLVKPVPSLPRSFTFFSGLHAPPSLRLAPSPAPWESRNVPDVLHVPAPVGGCVLYSSTASGFGWELRSVREGTGPNQTSTQHLRPIHEVQYDDLGVQATLVKPSFSSLWILYPSLESHFGHRNVKNEI